MKKIFLALSLFLTLPAHADYYYRHTHSELIAPAIGINLLGLSIGFGVQQLPQYYSPPVYVLPQPVYTAPPPYSYGLRYITVWDPACYCYKNILVSN